jgi:UDP-N-acetylglucosamine 4,6-dehydratase/5-epimerase
MNAWADDGLPGGADARRITQLREDLRMSLDGKVILITGGTGSFGRKFVEIVLSKYTPRKLIIFSRDEYKQHEMYAAGFNHACMRYFIGDVRDRDRLYRALDGVEVVVHTAAMKQVPACEYNPIEAIKTNVLGAANLVEAAIDRNVMKVLSLSTDKAAAPVNLYGATKLCADKLFISGNIYSGVHDTRFSVVRYGNVMGSRGSVIPLFRKVAASGVIPITDPRMTRFWLTLDHAVLFVLRCIERMEGGEVFVPKIPSMNITDLARAIAPDCRMEITGIRPGEKLHEVLIPEDDARHTVEYDDDFVIVPEYFWLGNHSATLEGGRPSPEGFRYSSDTNSQWLSVEDLQRILNLDRDEGKDDRL